MKQLTLFNIKPKNYGPFGKKGFAYIKPLIIPEDMQENWIIALRKLVKVSICGCWEWQGRIVNGYGCVHAKRHRSSMWAHRISYAVFIGDIAENMHIDHKCRNPICIRPSHLQQITPIENNQLVFLRKREDYLKQVNKIQLQLF